MLQALRSGLANQQIAETLNVSGETVKEHLHNIFRKLGVKNRTQAAVLAEREACARLVAPYNVELAKVIRRQRLLFDPTPDLP